MKKNVSLVLSLTIFIITAFFSWRLPAVFPAEYLGWPLGFSHPEVLCNCVRDAICQCPQPAFLWVNLGLDILLWLFFSMALGFTASFVLGKIKPQEIKK